MKDKLRQFIETHRDEFDSEIPGISLYGRIGGKPVRRGIRWYSAAFKRRVAIAASLIIFASASIVFLRERGNESGTANEVTRLPDELTYEDPVYARQISQYQEIIGLQQAELRQLKSDYPDLYRQFTADIITLDSAYRSLKLQIANHPNRETLLEAMLENLALQSELLTKQLYILREIKQKNKGYEKTNI